MTASACVASCAVRLLAYAARHAAVAPTHAAKLPRAVNTVVYKSLVSGRDCGREAEEVKHRPIVA